VRERGRKRKRDRDRDRERDRQRERDREREIERDVEYCPELLFLFSKAMMGALAPFSFIVVNNTTKIK
jgi:hypothetical protein